MAGTHPLRQGQEQRPPQTALRIVNSLIEGHQFWGIAVWAFATIVVIPMAEEIVFRCGLLQVFEAISCSTSVGILGSALVFGAAHLGGTLRPDRAHLMNSFWMFAAGVVLGAITVRKKGNLLPAIAAHSARNATEFAAMFFAFALN